MREGIHGTRGAWGKGRTVLWEGVHDVREYREKGSLGSMRKGMHRARLVLGKGTGERAWVKECMEQGQDREGAHGARRAQRKGSKEQGGVYGRGTWSCSSSPDLDLGWRLEPLPGPARCSIPGRVRAKISGWGAGR